MESKEKKCSKETIENPNDMTLEESFAKLEETVKRLETEDISLEESFRVYTEGMNLLKVCNDKIDRVEKKILQLNEAGELSEF